MKRHELPAVVVPSSRLCVMKVHVEPAQVWFHCPRCDAALEGFGLDPRGASEVTCELCGTEFDIPVNASIVIA